MNNLRHALTDLIDHLSGDIEVAEMIRHEVSSRRANPISTAKKAPRYLQLQRKFQDFILLRNFDDWVCAPSDSDGEPIRRGSSVTSEKGLT